MNGPVLVLTGNSVDLPSKNRRLGYSHLWLYLNSYACFYYRNMETQPFYRMMTAPTALLLI